MSVKLKNTIEGSVKKITLPNDCYNSSILEMMYKKNTGANQNYEIVKVSLCYGKQLTLVLWKDEKVFFENTLSSLKLKFEDGIFKNKYFSLKICEPQ